MIKVLVENHEENDKIRREEERKRQYTLHTITCERCNTKFHFYPENINITISGNGYSHRRRATVNCPCCRHSNNIDIHIAMEDESIMSSRDSKRSMDILEEGNFSIEMECDNCESKFSFNYSDTKEKKFKGEGADYTADVIICPICGKEHEVIN